MRKVNKGLLVLALMFVLATGLVSASVIETDVVIVGGGAAGLSAAIEAANAGVEVTVFEKLPILGGSTIVSGGGMSGSGHRFQIEAGITNDSPEQHFEDILREGSYQNSAPLAKRFTENAGAAIDWLADLGCDFEFQPSYPEHTIQRFVRSLPYPGTGIAIIQTLEKAAKEAGANIYTSHLVTELVTDTKGAVVGVQVLQADGTNLTVIADRVILATGGFVGNEEMLAYYAPEIWAMDPYCAGDTRLQGDGILMGKRAGVSLENMHHIKVYPTGSAMQDGKNVYTRYYVAVEQGGILVNREGVRFTSETNSFAQVYKELVKQTDGRMWVVFDNEMADKITEYFTPMILGWSNEQVAAEFENLELVHRGNTVEELAADCGLDASALAKTAKESNLTAGPFYAIEIGPNMMFTLGGLRINDDAQALNADGQVIPGLYAAGEVAGSGHGNNYMSGNYVAYSVVYGRIAGQNAASDVLGQ